MTKTLIVKTKTINKMKDFYENKFVDTPQYAIFQAKDEGVTITAYNSMKVVFQGKNAIKEASMWEGIDPDIKPKEEKKKIKLKDFDIIGTDEVGTGDYLAPIVVVATYLDEASYKYAVELGAKDSKAMNDDRILVLGEKLKKIPHDVLSISNEKYNERNQMGWNKNKILTNCHGGAIKRLFKRIPTTINKDIYIDQFVPVNKFNEHLEPQLRFKNNLVLIEKGESHSVAIAVASILARYYFLKQIDKINDELGITIQKGASKLVDEQGRNLVKKYGPEILKKYSKYHFANTKKILN
jgi:ribonuclease HIII